MLREGIHADIRTDEKAVGSATITQLPGAFSKVTLSREILTTYQVLVMPSYRNLRN